MVSELAPGLKRRRVVRRAFAVVGIAGAVATALAFRAFFARPGEDALRLVPKNAIVVGSVDLSPSPNQTLVFKKLDEALTRNGLDKQVDGALTDTVAQGAVAEALRPLAKRGAAFALLPPAKETGDDPQLIAYFGISDGAEVGKILKQHGKKKFWKGTQYYVLNNGGPGLMVVDDVLAVSPSGPALHDVELVMEGKSPSILERADFVAERQKIDADSNLMVFVSPEALALFAKDSPKDIQDTFKPLKWLSLGVAIRDGGIALSASGTFDQNNAKWMKDLAQVAPLRSDLLAVLPKGAYAVNAISQPSQYFTSFENSIGNDPEGRKAIKEMEKGLSKDLNVSLRQDVLPAFQGNAVAALYPSESSEKVGGIDVLVVIDDQNGAKAGPLAERLREAAEQSLTENSGDDKKPFEVSTDGDVKKYRLIGEAEDSLHDSLVEAGDDGVVNGELLAKDKTITWAIVGNTVIASSSTKLLDRAIANLKNPTAGLSTDALWSPYEKTLLDGSQTISAFSVARIAEGFENTLHIDKMGDEKETVQEIVDVLKTLKEPFRIQAKTTEGESTMKLFIPMDYDKLIDIIGKAMNQSKG